jgi:isopentenyl-diphosphate delta-isomerase
MSMEMMLLVDESDNVTGEMEKMEAHRKGLLHRAFSGFVFNDRNELLIQRRALGKYHNPGIWANTVCSHPRRGESIEDAVARRVFEELGFHAEFKDIGFFIYKAEFPNGMTEHELDHVCVASYNGEPVAPDPGEVDSFRWISRADLEREIAGNPSGFSYWLREILSRGIITGWA